MVFDLDGTLLDTMTLTPAAYCAAIRARGGGEVSPEEVIAAWHVGPTPAVLAHFLGRPVAGDDVECFYSNFEAAAAAVRPFPGVVEMVDELAAGFRLGIFTSAARRVAELALSAAGLGGRFAAVICGDDAPPKPSPAGLRLACRRLGVDVSATTYVGDALVDIQCARRAGATGIHARWGATAALDDAPLVADHPVDIVDRLVRPPSRRNDS
ncbi:HAD family hydrolase [Asanoa iriomotensis]|uniref:HAD family hydrolase n=1 Tax=Asanoa iriomotensis TaxID=234613 RepID=UPI0019414AD0|nr:HAD-IA family hydrolase [Asanoa iriomotensis]